MDAKAKKILLKTFWGGGGWKPGPRVLAGEEFEYARSQGLMFDPISATHDELVGRLRELHRTITKEQVAAAFLHSLSTRKTHLRSALSSWALTAELPPHAYEQKIAKPANTSSCGDCNDKRLMANDLYTHADLNVLNFERVKWGGIRLNWLLYCWMDLDLFSREEPAKPSIEDIGILREMLTAVRNCQPSDSARKLEKAWKDVVPSSKHERDVLMEILGYAGILAENELPRIGRGGDNDFVSMAVWQGQDGYNSDAVDYYFGHWKI